MSSISNLGGRESLEIAVNTSITDEIIREIKPFISDIRLGLILSDTCVKRELGRKKN